MKRELVVLLCVVAISVLYLYLMMPWVGQQSVVRTFRSHTHLLFAIFDVFKFY